MTVINIFKTDNRRKGRESLCDGYLVLKNSEYRTGIRNSTMTVPTRRPPVMVAAMAENISSNRSGIIPNTVVSDAMVTGRNLDTEACMMASDGVFED